MQRKSPLSLSVAIATFVLFITTFAQAAVTWLGTDTGNWSTTTNWSTGSTPNNYSDIVINGPDGTTVIGDGSGSYGALQLGVGNTFSVQNAYAFWSSVANQGTLRASAGGLLDLKGNVDNSGGTIDAQNGAVSIEGNITGGTLTSSGSGQITISNSGGGQGGLNNITNCAQINVANAILLSGTIANSGSISFHSGGSAISTRSETTTLTGGGNLTFNGGPICLSGTLLNVNNTLSGCGYLYFNDSTSSLENQGLIVATGTAASLQIMDLAFDGKYRFLNQGTLRVSPGRSMGLVGMVDNRGGTIDAQDGLVSIMYGSISGGTLTSSGTGRIEVISGGLSNVTNHAQVNICSASSLSATITNHGRIAVSSEVQLLDVVSLAGSGTMSLSGSGAQVSGTLTNSGNTINGTGKIAGMLTNGGIIAPGTSGTNGACGKIDVTGDLVVSSSSSLAFKLAGRTPGTTFDLLTEGGSVKLSLDGTLSISFADGFEQSVQPGDAFAIIISNDVITGQFTNVANGARLTTSDGLESFIVNYGVGSAFASNQVVLSDMRAVPEPSTWLLLCGGLGSLLVFRKRLLPA